MRITRRTPALFLVFGLGAYIVFAAANTVSPAPPAAPTSTPILFAELDQDSVVNSCQFCNTKADCQACGCFKCSPAHRCICLQEDTGQDLPLLELLVGPEVGMAPDQSK